LKAATHAEDAEPLDPAALNEVSPEDYPRLVLRFDPALSLLRSRWPIDRSWRANQPGVDANVTVDLSSGGVMLEVRRIGDDPVFRALDDATFAFRRALSEGGCLEVATFDALEAARDFDLTRAFRSLFAEHVPIGFSLSIAAASSSDGPH